MSAPLPSFPVDDVLTPAMWNLILELLHERARAVAKYGHTAEADDKLPLPALGEKAAAFLQIATERSAGSAERRILPGARMKAVQGIIVAIAFIEAIDREIDRESGTQ